MLLLKQGYRELTQLIHPKAVLPLKLGKTTVAPHVASAIFGFFFLYLVLLGGSTLVLTLQGADIVTSVSATISCLSNIGPGLGEVGPATNYGHLPQLSKIVLSFCMITGRLEILTVLVFLTPEFWKK